MNISVFNFHCILIVVFCCLNLQSQDSLVAEFLKKHTYQFEIINEEIVGAGAEFLEKEIEQSQYFLIGEYHQSPRISQLTSALIPVLNSNGFQHLILEVGPNAAVILNEMRRSSNGATQELKNFHTRYAFIEPDGYFTGAIPFFDFEEDAYFLQKSAEVNWRIAGIDQEYYNGYAPLLERMYDQLPIEKQIQWKKDKEDVIDSLYLAYWREIYEDANLYKLLANVDWLSDFISKMSDYPQNKGLRDAIAKTIQIYSRSLIDRDYVGNNQERVSYFKENLRNYFDTTNFDFNSDKMVVKMGAYHTSKGYNPMDMLDVGNFLSEVAELYNQKSLHISFLPRFVEEDGTELDLMMEEPDSPWNSIIQLGLRDKWTLVDVRPMKGAVFYYPKKFEIHDRLEQRILQHDLILIPPTDYEGHPQYDQNKIKVLKP